MQSSKRDKYYHLRIQPESHSRGAFLISGRDPEMGRVLWSRFKGRGEKAEKNNSKEGEVVSPPFYKTQPKYSWTLTHRTCQSERNRVAPIGDRNRADLLARLSDGRTRSLARAIGWLGWLRPTCGQPRAGISRARSWSRSLAASAFTDPMAVLSSGGRRFPLWK